MYKSLSVYIQQCDDDLLYELFEYVVEEMNRRKECESSGGAINAYIQGNKLEERQSLYRGNTADIDTS